MALPLPQPNDDTQPFWDYCRAGELRLQRCSACGEWRHPPRPLCPRCRSFEIEWAPVSGRGQVYSYVVTHQAVHPALTDLVPHAVVLVALEEGPLLTSNLVDCPPDEIAVDMAVVVTFEAVSESVTLPKFRRAG
jgi:uncharacterized OB-fold protein